MGHREPPLAPVGVHRDYSAARRMANSRPALKCRLVIDPITRGYFLHTRRLSLRSMEHIMNILLRETLMAKRLELDRDKAVSPLPQGEGMVGREANRLHSACI